jgi:hypothetical protein
MTRIALVICAALLVGGCQHARDFFGLMNPKPAPQPKHAGYCDVMNQQGGAFRWSKNDTRDTKERADKINAAGTKLCGW